jgi:uncharacterized membrane protein YkvA (DUF1232 family)
LTEQDSASGDAGGTEIAGMNRWQSRRCKVFVACSALLMLVAATPPAAKALGAIAEPHLTLFGAERAEAQTSAPRSTLDHRMHQLYTRADRALGRMAAQVGTVGMLWLGFVFSVFTFFVVAALASVVDLRMFSLRSRGPGELSRYLGHGIRMFFMILRDRRTPYVARSVLAIALIYWVLPFDLIPDQSVLPGFLDDVVIAVSAAKGFMYLCPDALVARHAVAIQSRAEATQRG